MPKYAALLYGEETGQPTEEAMAEEVGEYMEFGNNAGAAGVIAGGEALYDSSTATTLQVQGGKGGDVVFTDGPFAETKEVLGGFYLLDVADLDEAIKWAQQIPASWRGGRVEIRPVMEFSETGEVIS